MVGSLVLNRVVIRFDDLLRHDLCLFFLDVFHNLPHFGDLLYIPSIMVLDFCAMQRVVNGL